MTEQLPEQKQRGIYEWWGFRFDSDGTLPFHEMYPNLRPLYMPDGKENWNFVRECIEKLEQEHVRVMYDTADHLWYFWFLDNKGAGAVIKKLDFWFALSELLEGE